MVRVMEQRKKISSIVSGWVSIQKDLAMRLSITPASLSAMLSGKVALPLERFLQIVHILRPPADEVAEVWGLYLEDLNIPRGALELGLRGYRTNSQDDIRTRVHQLVDEVSESQLAVIEPILIMMKGKKDE